MTILSDAIYTCRKSRQCDQCLRRIEIGERYRRQVYDEDGLCTYRAHEDCDLLAQKLTELARPALNWDEQIMLHELGTEDRDWISKEYPAVAARLYGSITSTET